MYFIEFRTNLDLLSRVHTSCGLPLHDITTHKSVIYLHHFTRNEASLGLVSSFTMLLNVGVYLDQTRGNSYSYILVNSKNGTKVGQIY